MNRDALVECLRIASTAVCHDLGAAINDGRPRWAHISPEIAQPFGEALLSNEAIAELNGLWYTLPYQAGKLDFRTAAVYLIDRALARDAGEIIDDLLRFASTRTIELISVRSVEGITVNSPVELGDGFFILPPSALPDVVETKAVFSPSNSPRHGWGSPPSAAIVLREMFEVPFCAPPKHGESGGTQYRGDVEADMEHALWATTLASEGAPDFRQGYDVVLSCGWPGMTSGSMRATESFPVPVPRARLVDAGLAPKLFHELRKQQGKLDLAMNKLQASRRRNSFAESAMDLGTCLEILLMRESSSNTEISYKLASRAAWFLGITGVDRLVIFERARDLYTARSMAIHAGVAPKIKGSRNAPDEAYKILDSYDKLCAAIIVKIALQGGWPDWKKLVLNVDESA
jgi:hypothetical protein